jgi:flagellar basal body-associated protein FliL
MDSKVLTIIILGLVALVIVLFARSGKMSFLGSKFDFSKKHSNAEVNKSKKVEIDQAGDSTSKVTESEEIKINQKG